MVQIDANFKYKQLITVEEIATLIMNSGGIARQDLIYATGSQMTKPLKSIEETETFGWRKMAGLSNRQVKVYYADSTTYESTIANHYRALGTYALRQSGFRISQPMVLRKGEWGINLAIRGDTVLPLETVIVDSKNYTKLKGVKIRKKMVPFYIFTDIFYFEKVKTEGLLYGQSICAILGRQGVDLHCMNYIGQTEPLYALKQLDEFQKVQSGKEELVDEIFASYDTRKYTNRKKVRKINIGSD